MTCIEKQPNFLGMKQWLQELLVEREQKELDHWQANLMFDDQRAIHAPIRSNFEKVKDDFHVAQFPMQEFFKTFVYTYNVFVKSIDGKSQ
jgi:hypothetical protein